MVISEKKLCYLFNKICFLDRFENIMFYAAVILDTDTVQTLPSKYHVLSTYK